MTSTRSLDPDPKATRLAGNITVGQYVDMWKRKDRDGISKLIHSRFEERYLKPILDNPERHGFAVLAVCCLMVEAFESFRNGWKDTAGKSEAAFCGFFQAHNEFRELRPVAHEFYRAVRCGILHQAETTKGWRVDRKPGLFTEHSGARWVSASEFGKGLRSVLDNYRDELKAADWNSPLWLNARTKLKYVCKNCGLPDWERLK